MTTDPRLEAAADALMDAAYGQTLPEAPIDLATAAVQAADEFTAKANTITTYEQLAELPDASAIVDSAGDTAVIMNGQAWYPETAPVSLAYAARWLPATVKHRGDA